MVSTITATSHAGCDTHWYLTVRAHRLQSQTRSSHTKSSSQTRLLPRGIHMCKSVPYVYIQTPRVSSMSPLLTPCIRHTCLYLMSSSSPLLYRRVGAGFCCSRSLLGRPADGCETPAVPCCACCAPPTALLLRDVTDGS